MKGSKKIWTPIFCGIGIFLLIVDTKTALYGAREGINLCLRVVIPSLFPFFILSVMLTQSLMGVEIPILRPLGMLCGIPRGAESILLVGILGGYPVGAQCIAQAHDAGRLDRQDARRMLGFCSNAGPAFLFGMAGAIFDSWLIPWVLWGIHVLSALLVGLLLPGKAHSQTRIQQSTPLSLSQAMDRSLRIMASVSGWVVIFRVVLSILERWYLWMLPPTGQMLVTGLMELSNGCCALADLPAQGARFLLCSLFLALGGLCVAMQTISVTGRLGIGAYIPGKLLQGCLSLLMAAMAEPLLFTGENLIPITPVFPTVLVLCGGILTLFLWNWKKSSSNPAASGV